jgi:hypothetical protein
MMESCPRTSDWPKKYFLPKKIDSRAAVWVDIDGDGLEDAVICWKGEGPD